MPNDNFKIISVTENLVVKQSKKILTSFITSPWAINSIKFTFLKQTIVLGKGKEINETPKVRRSENRNKP